MLSIQIDTSNAAFAEPGELARIVASVARSLEDATQDTIMGGVLRDINGNRVGTVNLELGR